MAMEKIKNFLSSGNNDEVSGTTQAGTHTGGLTGEGSHLGGATNTTSQGGVGSNTTAGSGLTGNNNNNTTGSALGSGHPSHGGLTGEGSHLTGATGGVHDQSQTGNQSGLGLGSNTSSTTTGPHSSNLANKADPRVDSDNSRVGQSGLTGSSTGTGLGQNTSSTTTTGPHSSNLANKADPRVDSDNSRVGQSGLAGSNTGTTGLGQTSSHMPGSWDDETSTSQQTGSGLTGAGTSSHGLGSSTTGHSGLTQDSQNTNTSSGSHLGRDAAALGSAGAVGSGIHSHGNNDRNLASTTGQSDLDPYQMGSNTGSTGATGANTSSGSHLGRDAAAVGTAGAVGSAVHGHHNTGNPSSTTGTSGEYDPFRAATPAAGTTIGQNPLDRAGEQSHTGLTGSSHQTNTSGGSHLGRDAAALGTAGAVGEGIHSHRDHEHQQSLGAGIGQTGHNTSTHGPHSTDTANMLDPRVNTGGSGLETAHHHDSKHGGGAEEADHDHAGAAGTGSAAALGLASHEHNKHQTGSGLGQSSTGHQSTVGGSGLGNTTGPAPHTAGPHAKDWENVVDPRVTPANATQKGAAQTGSHPTDSSHHGRDAALVGGAGAAGLAAGSHHDSSRTHDPSHLGQSGATGTSSNYPSSSTTHQSGVAGQHDSSLRDTHNKDHHLGRDAAVAGGVGGAAYEADKHHKDTKTEHQAEKDHKHAVKEAEKEHKHAAKEEKKEHKHGILSFLHRDKSKKYTAEEDAEFDRQEREHNSHAGRNTALGGAAAGAGAYEAEKHHHAGGDANKPLPTAPGNHGIGTGAGTQNALAGNTSGSHGLGSGHNDHTGRDAALGAGAVGAAGVGAHEHDSHTQGTPLPEKPKGRDIGDILHGTDRNRGVTGSSGFPGTEGFGDGQHPHAHESGLTGTGHNTTGQTGREFPLGGAGTTGHSGSGLTGSEHQSGSHVGRDAAALGTAGAIGEHEHRKHEGTSGLTGSHGTTGNQTSGVTGATGTHHPDHQSHGLTHGGEQSVYRSDRDQTGLQHYAEHGSSGSGLTGSHGHTGPQSMGASGVPPTASSGHGLMDGKTSDLSGRNRLHKDPPADHPAAQAYGSEHTGGAHVPASGAQREQLVGEGREGLGHETGVANAHGTGANQSTNY